MRNLDIKRISAQNFLCFGSETLNIDFHKYGNVVLVKGDNYDVLNSDSKPSSNGVGKSSIPEVIVYTLFGKTIKHPKKINHKDVINNKNGKSLKTEVWLGDLRIVRTRKPDSLRVWESKEGIWNDSTEITLGGQPATQKLIEDRIGLNYETFVNVVIFTDNNAGSFLESDASNKREIVENLLSIEKYKGFAERAKNLKKDKKDEIRVAQSEYDVLRKQSEQSASREKAAKEQEEKWKAHKTQEISDLKTKINKIKKDLSKNHSSDEMDAYQAAQDAIKKITERISELEDKHGKARQMVTTANDKLNGSKERQSDISIKIGEVSSKIESKLSKIKENEKEITRLENNDGATCNYCLGVVSKDNYKKYTSKLIDANASLSKEVDSLNQDKSELGDKLLKLKDSVKKISEGITTAKTGMQRIDAEIQDKKNESSKLSAINKPQEQDTKEQITRQHILSLEEQVKDKTKELEEKSPFHEILKSLSDEIQKTKLELEEKAKFLEVLEKELPYYEFWSVAFGDSGIRKFIIDGIIPALNSRIAYWLQFLIDGKIKLEFNNELEELIERTPSDGDPFVYYAMSGGERRRLNLAVSQAFAHVMMLSSGTCPSLVFLDEVTTNIDQVGVVGVHNMIMELAKDRRVFITTHDQNLLEMLDGCELISLEKRNGLTRMKNSDY